MTTRRSTHANHAKPTGSTRRSVQKRSVAQGKVRGNKSRGGTGGIHVPTPNGELLLTRRHFLFGALGVGALAALGGGATVLIKKQQDDASGAVKTLEVPASKVTTLTTSDDSSEFTLIDDASTRMSNTGRFELPYGTLVWANGDDVAACLLPNDEAKPLTKVGLLSLSSGNLTTVLDKAVGQSDNFDIYDVRATTAGVIWTEANIFDNTWRLYTATSDGSSIGTPQLVDQGDSAWETPSVAAVGSYAFWQVLPKIDGPHSTEDSLVKRAAMGSDNAETVYTSHGRPCTPLYARANSVVVAPRADTTGTYYQLTHLDAASGTVLDSMVLPRAMRPLEAGYGDTGFMFSFDARYDYGDGISNLGTYAPSAKVSDSDYSDAPWFCFGRTPTAAPAWCGGLLMVKSSRTVCGIDLQTNEYLALQPDNGADDYGEYLASTGSNGVTVTYANIDDKPIVGDPKKYCLVKVWKPTA